MTDTTTHSLTDTAIDWEASDVRPADFDGLTPDEQQALRLEYCEHEKERLRAIALHARLAARGLGAEADVLRVQTLYGNVPAGAGKAERLEALETIVAQLEQGAIPGLLEAIASGAGTSAALRLLAAVQSPDNAAGFGERLAVALICKGDDEGPAFQLPADVAEKALAAIEIAAQSLENRLELVTEALQRLKTTRGGTSGLLQ